MGKHNSFENSMIRHEISHVLKAIGLDEPLATGTIRISLGKDNTEDDITRITDALKKILG